MEMAAMQSTSITRPLDALHDSNAAENGRGEAIMKAHVQVRRMGRAKRYPSLVFVKLMGFARGSTHPTSAAITAKPLRGTLMVRSAATPRVSNHEATSCPATIRPNWNKL